MNRISILILLLMFFSGCDDDTLSSSSDNSTMENMVGTWNMLSSTMDMTTAIDFNTAFFYMFDEENCTLGTWEDEDGDGYGCTMSDVMILVLAPPTCDQLEGELNDNVCTFSLVEEICCQESESSILTIASDGSITILNIDSEGETTETGTTSFNGTDITLSMDDSSELNGTLSMSGENSATITFELVNYLDELLTDNESDQSYIDAVEAGAISISGTMSMIMERLND